MLEKSAILIFLFWCRYLQYLQSFTAFMGGPPTVVVDLMYQRAVAYSSYINEYKNRDLRFDLYAHRIKSFDNPFKNIFEFNIMSNQYAASFCKIGFEQQPVKI